jgi:hypothetical protein
MWTMANRPDQRAFGRKVSDKFVVPLCRIHHRLVHRVGNESAWWKEADIDPVKAAGKLWKRTRLNEDRTAPKAGADQPCRAAGTHPVTATFPGLIGP